MATGETPPQICALTSAISRPTLPTMLTTRRATARLSALRALSEPIPQPPTQFPHVSMTVLLGLLPGTPTESAWLIVRLVSMGTQ